MRHLLGGPAWHPRRPCTSPSCSYRVIALMRPAASRLGRSWSGCPAARRPPRRSSPKCRRASHRQEACLGWACIDGVQCDTRPRLRLGRHAAYVCCLQRLGTGACATAAAQGRAPPLLHPPHHTCRSKLLLLCPCRMAHSCFSWATASPKSGGALCAASRATPRCS